MRRVLALWLLFWLAACDGGGPPPARFAGAPPTPSGVEDGQAGARDAGDVGPRTLEPSDPDAGSTAALDAGDAPPPVPHRALFLGNSYTSYNDLSGRYRDLAAAPGDFDPLDVREITVGGRRLVEHAAAAREPGDPLERLLVSGSDEERAWDAVILQEQSQIPGFDAEHPERVGSQDAAVELAGLADAVGARAVLFMTWGRRDGDDTNPAIFPDFPTMQARLEEGYRSYAAAIRGAGHEVWVAPVGTAFALVYDDDREVFADLYSSDGSHPSPQGTYLAACVIVATAAGLEADPDGAGATAIDPARAQYLRDIARQAIELENGMQPDDGGDAGAP